MNELFPPTLPITEIEVDKMMIKVKKSTKKRICRVVGFLLFVLMLGIVRGMDMGIMPVGKGAALALGCELVGAAALWKGGVIRVR